MLQILVPKGFRKWIKVELRPSDYFILVKYLKTWYTSASLVSTSITRRFAKKYYGT